MNPILERFLDRLRADLEFYKDTRRTWTEYVKRGLVREEDARSHIGLANERIQLKLGLLRAGFGMDVEGA